MAQAGLVVESHPPIGRHDHLEQADQGRAAPFGSIDLTGVEIGVAGMEQPAAGCIHRDPAMAERVAEQRHQQDLRRQPLKPSDRLESEPRLAFLRIGAIIGAMGPHQGTIAALRLESAPRHRGVQLGGMEMDPRVGKVRQSADMIQIHVGKHDMPDITGRKSQRLDLRDRRQRRIALRTRIDMDELAAEPARQIGIIGGAEPGIDQHQAARRGFDQQHVTGEMAAVDRQTLDAGAAQMMHFHGLQSSGIVILRVHMFR